MAQPRAIADVRDKNQRQKTSTLPRHWIKPSRFLPLA